jgi:hypothetical protein
MPRYFFHVADGADMPDHEGTVLSGIPAARDEAIRTAGEIIKDEGGKFWNGAEWEMTVKNEAGESVLTLRFSADDHSSSGS